LPAEGQLFSQTNFVFSQKHPILKIIFAIQVQAQQGDGDYSPFFAMTSLGAN
jgi:hypothetical protein